MRQEFTSFSARTFALTVAFLALVTSASAAPQIQFSPSPLRFGRVSPSGPASTLSVTVTNTGDAPLVFNGSGYSLVDGSQGFSVVPISIAPLTPGGTRTISIVCVPITTGPLGDQLLLDSNASNTGTTLGMSAYALEYSPLLTSTYFFNSDENGSNPNKIMAFDIISGDRVPISGRVSTYLFGTGDEPAMFYNAVGMHDGDLLIVGKVPPYPGSNAALMRVDPITGDRTVISSPTVGSGPPMTEVLRAAIIIDDTVLLQHFTFPTSISLVGIDLTTGNRTTISSDSVGSGPVLRDFDWMTYEPSQEAVLGLSISDNTIMRVKLNTGDRTIVSTFTPVGGFPPFAIFLHPDGRYLLPSAERVFTMPAGGSSTLTEISGPSTGSGPTLTFAQGFGITQDGDLLVGDRTQQAIFRVNLDTGARSIVASSTVGAGDPPTFLNRGSGYLSQIVLGGSPLPAAARGPWEVLE